MLILLKVFAKQQAEWKHLISDKRSQKRSDVLKMQMQATNKNRNANSKQSQPCKLKQNQTLKTQTVIKNDTIKNARPKSENNLPFSKNEFKNKPETKEKEQYQK